MDYRYGSHTVYNIEYRIVWVPKRRYTVLTGDVALRVRVLVRQTCEIIEIKILQGIISKDHVPNLVSAPPNMASSEIIRRIKGRTSSKLFEEFPILKKALQGTALLGTRGLLCHGWTDDGKDEQRVSATSVLTGSGGQLSHRVLTTGLDPYPNFQSLRLTHQL